MKLYEMTWPEVEEYLQNKSEIIIPVGTCEQHGKHLPLNTDTLIAEYFANYLSNKTGIIVAPTINYGVNLPCDKHYSGTNSLKKQILTDLVCSILDWWKFQGFKHFFIISAHADTFHIQALKETGLDNVDVLELCDLDLTGILEKQKRIMHACEGETSLMLYLHPNLVKKDLMEDFITPFKIMKDYINREKEDKIIGSPGNNGFSSAATESKGKAVMEKIEEFSYSWLKQKMGRA